MALLSLQGVSVRVGGKTVCTGLDLELPAAHRLAVLGENGVGKTTLIHSIMGLHRIESGKIYIAGRNIADLSVRDRARQIGVLFQESPNAMPATVLETVMLGRHPHSRSLFQDDPEDITLAHAVLGSLGLDAMSDRQAATLSGGEKQRLAIAVLLVQSPRLFLLDEPGNHLDIAFQVKALQRVSDTVTKENAGLVMATHDINLAARYCETILLLLGHGRYLLGPRGKILTSENLSRAYQCEIRSVGDFENPVFFPA
ncbi:MAG: ABC transporter ATP-binding protein [Pseudohongiellaceae bacterium]